MKTYVVIGLGRFGTAVATELCKLGNEVLAVDSEQANVQAIADHVTHAVTADARDPAVLKALGVRNFDCAIVAVGNDIGNSALITLSLKEIGVAKVICKSQSHVHHKVLEKIGADKVVFPEHEMGVKLAQNLNHSNVLNFIELSSDAGIVEVPTPKSWHRKTIKEMDVRNKYRVNIIAVRDVTTNATIMSPGSEYVLRSSDILIVAGEDQYTSMLHDL